MTTKENTNDVWGMAGKGVLVTGGGTGIGAACAASLAAVGAAVTICGRTEEKLVATVERIECGAGGSVHYVVADVQDEATVAAAVEAAAAVTGTLDGVVANAGGGGGMGPLQTLDIAEFRRVLDLNLVGTMLTLKHSVPFMVEAGGGSFVAMSSIAGSVTHNWFGAYPPAKAGIEHLMRNAADEFGVSGVRCNAIAPGFIATEIMSGVPRDSEVFSSYIENTPMGDVGEPDDVGRLARFLLSGQSRWITGQVIAVDGGHGLRRGPDFGQFIAAGYTPEQMAGGR